MVLILVVIFIIIYVNLYLLKKINFIKRDCVVMLFYVGNSYSKFKVRFIRFLLGILYNI